MRITVPDSGTEIARWVGNVAAVPIEGMHIVWRAVARDIAARVLKMRPDALELEGHSRGGAIAVYAAIYVRCYSRHIPIHVDATGVPRLFARQKWRYHYDKILETTEVRITNGHGDLVGYLPPVWHHSAHTEWVGPQRSLSIEAHYPAYVEKHREAV